MRCRTQFVRPRVRRCDGPGRPCGQRKTNRPNTRGYIRRTVAPLFTNRHTVPCASLDTPAAAGTRDERYKGAVRQNVRRKPRPRSARLQSFPQTARLQRVRKPFACNRVRKPPACNRFRKPFARIRFRKPFACIRVRKPFACIRFRKPFACNRFRKPFALSADPRGSVYRRVLPRIVYRPDPRAVSCPSFDTPAARATWDERLENGFRHDGGTRPDSSTASTYTPNPRLITIRCTSLVPSPMSSSFWSR